MDLLDYLGQQMQEHLAKARAIADTADKEGRGLSEVERKEAEAELATVQDFKMKIADEKDKARLRGLVDNWDKLAVGETSSPTMPDAGQSATAVRAKTIGEAFIASEGFQLLAAKYKALGSAPNNFRTPEIEVAYDVAMKTTVLESGNTELFGSGGGAGSLTTLLPLKPELNLPLAIADLIQTIPVSVGNSVSYPVVKTPIELSGTSFVTEGQGKPEVSPAFDVETAVLGTLAGWVKVSQQFLEDAPGLAAFINADLPFKVRLKEEHYLADKLYDDANLAADGSGIGGTNGFDAIQEAISLIAINGGNANGLVISPTDWAALLTAKFSTFGYVGGGPFGSTGNPWNLRVVVTPSATDGLPLVGDFNMGAKIYRRGGMSVTSTNSDGTDFTKNLITIRAEERMVLGTSYPYLFCVCAVGTS